MLDQQYLPRWTVCQIGAREHYAVSRILHRAGALSQLITDVWAPPNSPLRFVPGRLGKRLAGRYEEELSDADVVHFTAGYLARELASASRSHNSPWDFIIDRNRWFQTQVIRYFRSSRTLKRKKAPPIVLAYSYAARQILATARDAGAITMLAQIDGGKRDEDLIAAISLRQKLGLRPDRAPNQYWDDWYEECRIADRILVNSTWSKDLLIQAGIEYKKIVVVPVIYERGRLGSAAGRQYPLAFNAKRPLRVLFLGALTLRKGVLETLEAARALSNAPVVFNFVGADTQGFLGACSEPNVVFQRAVPRSQVRRHYLAADLFLFPTHSDGFGMTQVEALEFGLPVIASRHCADIVVHGKSGLILEDVSGKSIAAAITSCLEHPTRLSALSANAIKESERYSQQSVAAFLEAAEFLQATDG